MDKSMIGEERLLEYFKSERDRLLTNFASEHTPPEFEEVKRLVTYQSAIQAVEALIRDGGFKPIEGKKPKSLFLATGSEADASE